MVGGSETETLRRSALDHLWMHNADWVKMAEEGGLPPIVVEGRGVKVVDSDGNTWIDAVGGYASVNVGYGRHEIAEAAREQMLKLAYSPQGTATEPLVLFVEKLAEITPGDLQRTWPVTGGSEANETAIKIVRAYHRRTGSAGRYKIISRHGSYHGGTGGVMWLGGPDKSIRADYEPACPGMLHAPQPNPRQCELGGRTPSECAVRCAQAIEDLIVFHSPETVAAVIAEPISSYAGRAVPGDEYWPMLRRICDAHGVLLIADEVVCGFGRTGKMFGLDHWNVVPDIMTVGKGIVSSYLPVAAAIATGTVADVFAGEENIFRQALTFGGHPVAAAAALKNIELIEQEGLVRNSADMGAYFLERFKGLQDEHPTVGDAWGRGLFFAVELVADRETRAGFPEEFKLDDRLTEIFRRERLVVQHFPIAAGGLRSGEGQTLNMSPPLCITRSETDEIVNIVDRALGELERELRAS